jgi:hypothetical protein
VDHRDDERVQDAVFTNRTCKVCQSHIIEMHARLSRVQRDTFDLDLKMPDGTAVDCRVSAGFRGD